MKSSEMASVAAGVEAIDRAISLCQSAGRDGEVEQLKKARNSVQAQLDWLKARPEQRKRRTPEQVEALVKNGDPDCPKGMAYKDRTTEKEILCKGPAPVGMKLAQAKAYFERRDFKVTLTGDTKLRAEYGAELFELDYTKQGPRSAPSCFAIYPPPGMSWQEAVARATGASVQRIEADKPVKAVGREWQLRVQESETKVLVQLGDC